MHGLERRLVKLEPRRQSQTPPCRVLLGSENEFEEMARQASDLEALGFQVMQIHLVGGVRNAEL